MPSTLHEHGHFASAFSESVVSEEKYLGEEPGDPLHLDNYGSDIIASTMVVDRDTRLVAVKSVVRISSNNNETPPGGKVSVEDNLQKAGSAPDNTGNLNLGSANQDQLEFMGGNVKFDYKLTGRGHDDSDVPELKNMPLIITSTPRDGDGFNQGFRAFPGNETPEHHTISDVVSDAVTRNRSYSGEVFIVTGHNTPLSGAKPENFEERRTSASDSERTEILFFHGNIFSLLNVYRDSRNKGYIRRGTP
jgi:hypothetical protein